MTSPTSPSRSTPAFWRRIWEPRDLVLTVAGVAGELLVARARLVFASLIALVPLVSVFREPARHENWLGLGAASGSALLAAAVATAVRRGWHPSWLGLATCLYDVTIVSAVLVGLLLVGTPHMAVNSRVTFEIYFIVIGATCLRYDRRLCTITGVAATVQYSAIVIAAAHWWKLDDPSFAPFPYGHFSAADQVGRVILLVVATLLSITIVDRTERLRVLSTHDSLTGLCNRAYFEERLEEELLRARRYMRPLALAIVDIDHFKSVNDRFGHLSGDIVLRTFSGLFRDAMRRTDVVARYGGEEFAVLLPETTCDEALLKLDRMRADISARAIHLGRGEQEIRLSFSAGVACMPADGERAEDLVIRADARLLAAKQGGRNRVV